MKKYIFLVLLTALILFSGCNSKGSEVSQDTVSKSSQIQQSNDISDMESSVVVFPEGLSTYSKGKLQYTNNTLSVIFTDEFYIQNDNYKPKNGIYLQNDTGTATLLIESITDNTVSNDEMLEYLKETYPNAEVSSNDSKEIIIKHTSTDKSQNNIFTIQKLKVIDNGYKQIVLSCRQSDKDKYIKIFNSINFS